MNKKQHQAINANYNNLQILIGNIEALYEIAKRAELKLIDKTRFEKYTNNMNNAITEINEAIKEIVLLEVENL